MRGELRLNPNSIIVMSEFRITTDNFILSVVTLLLLACLVTLPIAGLPVSQNILSYGTINYTPVGWLHTEGKWIKDETGNIIRFKGAAYARLHHNDRSTVISQSHVNLMRESGANVVRFLVNDEYYSDPTYLDLMDTIIGWCKAVGLLVIVDLHRVQFYDLKRQELENPQSMIDNWVMIAERYKDELAVIGAGIYNEPPGPSDLPDCSSEYLFRIFRSYAEQVSKAIHEVNPHWLILVGNIDCCYDLCDWLGNFLEEPNIVYTIHRYYHYNLGTTYYGQLYSQGKLEDGYIAIEKNFQSSIFCVQDAGYPVILEEFGAWATDPYFIEQIEDVHKLMKEHEVGVLQWWFYPQGAEIRGEMLTRDGTALNVVGESWKRMMLCY